MSDKIGDYIHYKYDNYLKYGLTVEESGNKPNIQTILADQRSKILKQAKNNMYGNKNIVRQQIKEQLNFLYGFGDKTINIGGQDYTSEQVFKKFQEALNQKFMNEAEITGTLEAKSTAYNKLSEFKKRANLKLDQEQFKTEAIMHRLDFIKQYYSMLGNKIKLTARQEEFMGWFNILKQELHKLKPELKQQFIDLSQGKNNGNYYIKINKKDMQEYMEVNNIIGLINIVYHYVRKVNLSNIAGEAAELFVGFANVVANNTTSKTLDQLINEYLLSPTNVIGGNATLQKVMVGSQFAVSGIGSKNFQLEGKSNFNGQLTNYFRRIGDNSIEIKPLQDKVDVVLKNINGANYYASVKNYNFKTNNDISILSGANILIYLQEYSIFLNHYMNITAHPVSGGPAADDKIVAEEVRRRANRTLIMSLTLKAMAGGLLSLQSNGNIGKSQAANIFIVNDKSKQNGFQVYFIDDFIEMLKQKIDSIENYVKISGFTVDQVWNQEWEGDKDELNRQYAYKRILNILLQLQRQALHISIPLTALEAWKKY